MSAPTRDEVEAVLLHFMQRCFAGQVPELRCSDDDIEFVVGRCMVGIGLRAHDQSPWPEGKRAALYGLLGAAVTMLQLHPPYRFPFATLHGSSADFLDVPLLAMIANVPGESVREWLGAESQLVG